MILIVAALSKVQYGAAKKRFRAPNDHWPLKVKDANSLLIALLNPKIHTYAPLRTAILSRLSPTWKLDRRRSQERAIRRTGQMARMRVMIG